MNLMATHIMLHPSPSFYLTSMPRLHSERTHSSAIHSIAGCHHEIALHSKSHSRQYVMAHTSLHGIVQFFQTYSCCWTFNNICCM